MKLKTRTIKTHKRDPKMANSPYGEFFFDYNDGQKTHDEKMTLKTFLEKRTVYKSKVFQQESNNQQDDEDEEP